MRQNVLVRVGSVGAVAGPGDVPQTLLGVVRVLLPDVSLEEARLARGQFHDVVLLPGVAAVRIARREATAAERPVGPNCSGAWRGSGCRSRFRSRCPTS